MTYIAAYSPNLQDLTVWSSVTADVVLSTTQKRSGSYSYRCTADTTGDKYLQAAVPAAASYYVRVAIFNNYIANVSYPPLTLQFREGTTVHTVVKLFIGDNFCVAKTLLNTTESAYFRILDVVYNSWSVWEFFVTTHNSTGVLTVKANGNTTYSGTGLDTQNGGTGVIDNIRFCSTGLGGYVYLDDIVIRDDMWPGRGGLYILPPTAEGSASWTPSAGDAHDCVSDNPPDDFTDYVYTGTSDAVGTHVSDALAAGLHVTSGTFVQVSAKGKKDTLTSGELAGYLDSNGTAAPGTQVTMGTTAAWAHHALATNPGDSDNPWTIATIDDCEIGVKSGTLTA